MDIGTAFTYMFDDEDWIKKLAIGGVAIMLFIVIVPLFLVTGYMLETIKNVRDGRAKPLPEWNDLGSLIIKGFMVFVIGLVYNIPVILIACAAAVVLIAGGQMDADVQSSLGIVSACLNCVQTILSLLVAVILPAGIIRYAQYETLGSAFQFGEVFNFIKDNIGDYIIAVLLGMVAQFISVFGLILCVIGLFFTAFWSTLVNAHLYGQLARKIQNPV